MHWMYASICPPAASVIGRTAYPCVLLVTIGCVSPVVHQQTLKELEEGRKSIAALRQDNARLSEELRDAQTRVAHAQQAVDAANKTLLNERESRMRAEADMKKVREEQDK